MKNIRFILAILFVGFLAVYLTTCGGGGGGGGASNSPGQNSTTALEDTVKAKAQTILPSEEYAIFQESLTAVKADPNYKDYLDKLNQTFDNLKAWVQKAQQQSLERKTANKIVTEWNLSNMVGQMKSTLANMFSDWKRGFLNAGMGFGRGVLGGAGGSISATVLGGLGVQVDGGYGLEQVYDFKHFQKALFPVSECSVGVLIPVGEGGGISGEVNGSYYENWIFKFQRDIRQDYEGAGTGGSVLGSLEGALVLGLGINGGVGKWQGINAACDVGACPSTTSNVCKSNVWGINYALGVSFTAGAEEKVQGAFAGSLTSSCTGSALGTDTFLDSALPKTIRWK